MRRTYVYLFALFSLVVCVAGLPTPFIKTKQLRKSRYRKHAIAQHKIANPGYTPTQAKADQAGTVQLMSCPLS